MRPSTIVGLTVLVVGLLAGGAAICPVSAQDDQPAPVPPSFHGDVTIDGEPAPDGIEVVALVDGEERGSATVEDGQYGGADWSEDKLVVEGSTDDENSSVAFEVAGVKATQTAEWRAETSARVDLSIDELDEKSGGPSLGGGGQGPPHDGSTPSPNDVPVPGPDDAQDNVSDDTETDPDSEDAARTDGKAADRENSDNRDDTDAQHGFAAFVTLASIPIAIGYIRLRR